MSRRTRLRTSTVVGVAALVAAASFGLEFVLSYEPTPTVETAGSTPSSTVTTVATTAPVDEATTTTATDAPTPTTEAPTTAPPETAPPTTLPLPTTTVPGPTVPPTSAPVTLAPTTSLPLPTVPPTIRPTPTTSPAPPGRLEVNYPRDSQGRMVLLAGGSSAVILRNPGGTAVTFTVTGSGAITVGATGTASGLLAPAEARSVPVVASSDPPAGPGPHATISVFGAGGLVASIPVIVT